MSSDVSTLPEPSALALAHSEKLVTLMRERIEKNGPIAFSDYMKMALYEPGLGYYQSGTYKFGQQGDFTTAPEMSPLFSYCLAKQCMPVLKADKTAAILEFGAGSGKMAGDILHYLAQENCLPSHYYILEVSADCRARQETYLKKTCGDLKCEVVWLDQLPVDFSGVILANEVLDAMPIELFCYQDNALNTVYVDADTTQFKTCLKPANDKTLNAFNEIKNDIDLTQWPNDYTSEINPLLPGWIKSLSACLKQGLVLLIDYGFSRFEYYHPDRYMGTLIGHYQHHTLTDPFYLPGLMDLTAHVDFTAVVQAATTNGFDLEGYCTQAQFLLNQDITGLLETITAPTARLKANSAIKLLTLPNEMGDLFKVMGLSKGIDIDITGFDQGDISYKL
jgi:SAM-dependent MidA family methyltransferase